MTRALVPLSMTTIGLLPDRCRGCVAWELDADGVRSAVRLGDTEFEKEVWLSGVMLTWGSAGQIVTVDDQPVGFALFAPPTAVPGASAFPTSPVSPDAVLLTTARILPEFTGQGLARYLMNGRGAAPSPGAACGRSSCSAARTPRPQRRASRPRRTAASERSAPVARTGPAESTAAPVPAARRIRPGRRLRGGRRAPPLPAAAVRTGPGHRLEGRGGVGAGEAVHRDPRAGVPVAVVRSSSGSADARRRSVYPRWLYTRIVGHAAQHPHR